MTREEAVTTLKDISERVHKQKEIEKSTLYGILDSYNEPIKALDMAIKALEQEPCEDCISRKEALDLVEDMTDQFGEGHRVITEGVISMLPPVTPKPKTDVLDKIRAEIELNRNEWIKGKDAEWHTYDRCLFIIDKYKAESEGNNNG